MQFAGTKDNMQRERISGSSIWLVSLHPQKARVRPSTQISQQRHRPFCSPRAWKNPWNTADYPPHTTQLNFHQDFSQVYKHFLKELGTTLFTLPGYTHQLHWRHGDTPVNTNVYTFQGSHSLPSRFCRNVERCITKGVVYLIKCGFYSSPWPGQTQELVQKNRLHVQEQ